MRITVWGGVLCLGCAPFVGPVLAQSGENGLLLGLSLSQRFEVQRADTAEDQTFSSTGINVSAESRTRTQTLRFGAGTSLRLQDGQAEFGARRAQFSYELRGKDSELRFSGNYSRDDIEYLRPAELILNDAGELEIPTDVGDLTGTGLRERSALDFNMSLFRNAPFGLGLSASRTDLNYSDVISTSLNDTTRSRLSLSARFDLSDALTLNTQVGQTWIETDTMANRQILTYGASLSTGTRLARVGLSFDAAREDVGTRTSTSLFWSQDLPGRHALSFSLGLTQAVTGDGVIKASAAYTHALRNGSVRMRYDRSVAGSVRWQRSCHRCLQSAICHRPDPDYGPFSRALYGRHRDARRHRFSRA